jgi:hypothetical protein
MNETNDWVRLGMALVLIALVSVGMYSFTGHARGAGAYSGASFVQHP